MKPSCKLAGACLFFSSLGAVISPAQTAGPETSPPARLTGAERAPQSSKISSAKTLEKSFFTLVRSGDPDKLLDYVSEGGVNVGPDAQHVGRTDIQQQIRQHQGIYCKLFDSACMQSQIQLDNSGVRQCSYRELLTSSKNVRTAATETTRNGIRQAILIAQVKNEQCAGVGLIDFIFNAQSDGWKLFSLP